MIKPFRLELSKNKFSINGSSRENLHYNSVIARRCAVSSRVYFHNFAYMF